MENRNDYKKLNMTRLFQVVGLILGLAIICWMYLFSFRYVLPVGDDYSFYNQLMDDYSPMGNPLSLVLSKQAETYINWQGTYFTNFLLYSFSAIAIRMGIHFNQVFLFTAFVIILFALCRVLDYSIRMLGFEVGYFRYVLGMGVYVAVILNLTNPDEFFYWFTGACAYSIPYTTALFGIIYAFKYRLHREKKSLCLAAILGFLAAGGSLPITAFVNSVYTLIIATEYLSNRKRGIKLWIPFGVSFLGGVLNVIAPGNFTRYGVNAGEHWSVWKALEETAIYLGKSIWYLSTNTFFVPALILMVIILMWKKPQNADFKISPFLFWFFEFASVYVVIFPVIYGYASTILPSRVRMVVYTTIVLETMWNTVYSYAFYAGRKRGIWDNKVVLVTLLSTCIVFGVIAMQVEQPMHRMQEEITKGKLKDFYTMAGWAYYIMDNNPNSNVIIDFSIPGTYQLMNVDLADENNWVNKEMAHYYNNVSIKYEPSVN